MLNQIIKHQKKRSQENFPVGSLLVPKEKRKAIIAFYNFVRFADEIADHPRLKIAQKIAYLEALEQLLLKPNVPAIHPYFNEIVDAVLQALKIHDLKPVYLQDLLTVFKKECTHQHPDHVLIETWDDLLEYCKYSANPVGRFLIDLFGESQELYPQADALCTLLQILNHIQDVEKDWQASKRAYIPKKWWANKAVPMHVENYKKLLGKLPAFLEKIDGFSDHIQHPRFRKEVAFIQICAQSLASKLMAYPTSPINVKLNKVQYLMCFCKAIVR